MRPIFGVKQRNKRACGFSVKAKTSDDDFTQSQAPGDARTCRRDRRVSAGAPSEAPEQSAPSPLLTYPQTASCSFAGGVKIQVLIRVLLGSEKRLTGVNPWPGLLI